MSDGINHLRQAIERNANAVLMVKTAGLTRLTRSRLLASDETGDDATLWAGLPTGQAEAIDGMIHRDQDIRVNFRAGQQNVEFYARVLERRVAYQLNTTTRCEAVRLAWPSEVLVVQRRAAYRVALTGPEDVRLKFWLIEKEAVLAAAPQAGTELTIDVRDFSETGIGGIWKRRPGEPPVLSNDQRLRVDVITPIGTTTVEAYCRFLAGLPEPEFRRIGVQFMLSPTNLADRAKLATLGHLVGELQRAELKRLRVAR